MQNPFITLTGDADTSVIFIMWINVCTHRQFSLTESSLHCIHLFLRHPFIFENKDRNWASGQRLTPRNCVFSWLHSVPLDFLKTNVDLSHVREHQRVGLLWLDACSESPGFTLMEGLPWKQGDGIFSKYINPTIIPSHSIPPTSKHTSTHTGTAPHPFHK